MPTTDIITATLGEREREVGDTFEILTPRIWHRFEILAKKFDPPSTWHPQGAWWYTMRRICTYADPGHIFAQDITGPPFQILVEVAIGSTVRLKGCIRTTVVEYVTYPMGNGEGRRYAKLRDELEDGWRTVAVDELEVIPA